MSLHGSLFVPPYRQLAMFASNFVVGIESARSLPRSFSIALRSLHHTAARRALEDPVETYRAGTPLAETLRPAAAHLPSFVLPIIEAGESTGQLETALRYLQHHCQLMTGAALSLRNAWLFPLVLLLIGDIGLGVMLLAMGAIPAAGQHLAVSCLRWLLVGLLILAMRSQLAKPLIDLLQARLPWSRNLEIALANHRFFRSLSLQSRKFRRAPSQTTVVAAATISNQFIRKDYDAVANELQHANTFTEAFHCLAPVLDKSRLERLAAAERADTLATAFAQLADESEQELARSMASLRRFAWCTTCVTTLAAIAIVIARWPSI